MSGRKTYVEMIEAALGIAVPGKTAARLEFFDEGRRIGCAATFPSGKRHGITVMFEPGWLDDLLTAFRELAADKPELMEAANG